MAKFVGYLEATINSKVKGLVLLNHLRFTLADLNGESDEHKLDDFVDDFNVTNLTLEEDVSNSWYDESIVLNYGYILRADFNFLYENLHGRAKSLKELNLGLCFSFGGKHGRLEIDGKELAEIADYTDEEIWEE